MHYATYYVSMKLYRKKDGDSEVADNPHVWLSSGSLSSQTSFITIKASQEPMRISLTLAVFSLFQFYFSSFPVAQFLLHQCVMRPLLLLSVGSVQISVIVA